MPEPDQTSFLLGQLVTGQAALQEDMKEVKTSLKVLQGERLKRKGALTIIAAIGGGLGALLTKLFGAH